MSSNDGDEGLKQQKEKRKREVVCHALVTQFSHISYKERPLILLHVPVGEGTVEPRPAPVLRVEIQTLIGARLSGDNVLFQ